MAAILNSANLNSTILDMAILVFPLKLTPLAEIGSHHLHKKTSHTHSDSTWWWQPPWILPCWIQTLPSWIQTPCYLLSDSLKNTLTPLWLWIQINSIWTQSHSFSLNLMKAAILNSAILDSTILHKKTSLIHSDSTWWWQPSSIWPSWIQPS